MFHVPRRSSLRTCQPICPMPESPVHICVGICTFKRPEMAKRLLGELTRQHTAGRFTLSVVVVDNDAAGSAQQVVEEFGRHSGIPTRYILESKSNIAVARNRVVESATGDFLAFIDDDEFPVTTWLEVMLATCEQHGVAGVLGPVLPHFEAEPPHWLTRGGFYDRPRQPTGSPMPWQKSRTGNVLLRRVILETVSPPFDPAYGEGGEDIDFFRRMNALGHRFVWCDEGIAYETVPPHRWTRGFLLHRALLRGQNTFRQSGNRWKNVLKSLLAAPLYIIVLPVLLIAGHHWFMKYLVRLCDHLGRLLAVARMNPVSERRH
jgi:succinoglycan biosynthesis protein ExoM